VAGKNRKLSEVAAWHKLSGLPDDATEEGEVVARPVVRRSEGDRQLLRATILALRHGAHSTAVRSLARLANSYLLAGDAETARRYIARAQDLVRQEEEPMVSHGDPGLQAHPAHEALGRVIRGWFHQVYAEMGYQTEIRRWGTYWNNDQVYVRELPEGEVAGFLADLRVYYGNKAVHIHLDSEALVERVGPKLLAAGCALGRKDIFLAHVGSTSVMPKPGPDLYIEPAVEGNLAGFAEARLRAFADNEGPLDERALQEEVERRRGELGGIGRGLLARIEDQAAGMIWWYDDPLDIWINFLATRVPFRGRGIGEALLRSCLAQQYDEGRRSVLINVLVDNERAIRLYRRLGFTDMVYWRLRYEFGRAEAG
jgi:ribosomal protein S18 acetylase RimI-like enzyme